MADLQPRLKAQYDSVIRQKLIEQFGYTNRMQVPTLDKVVDQHGHRRGRQRSQEGR